MSDLDRFKEFVRWFDELMWCASSKKRARNKNGTFKGDDPLTKNKNEAWE